MKQNVLVFILFFLFHVSCFAQKLSLNSIKVADYSVYNAFKDTVYTAFSIDSQGYKQGPFRCRFKNVLLIKSTYKNDILMDSCFWYTQEGEVFAKGNFLYKDDYSKRVGLNIVDPSTNDFAYLNDTLIVYNHPSDRSKPSILVYADNLKNGVLYINSKDGFRNVFTYKNDTLHGYFKNTFLSNPNVVYERELFYETGNFWQGENSYDNWYYKYQINNTDTVLIQKTFYQKNVKQESHTYYFPSGNKQCASYYSADGIVDSIRCNHEQGSLKSIIRYDKNNYGIEYTYAIDGELIKKASYHKGMLHGEVYEYSYGHLETKEIYKNDTIIKREHIQNNVVWQRVYYLNNEVEKVEWLYKGIVKNTTRSETMGTGDGSIRTSYRASGKKEKALSTEELAVKISDLVLFKPFPVGHKFYSIYYFNYSNVFAVSKRENNFFKPAGYYNYVLKPLQDSLTAYAKTKEGAALSKLKNPIDIVLSISLLRSDADKGFYSVQLKNIENGENKKVKKSIQGFFTNRTIPCSFRFPGNQSIECSYTIYPN